MPSQAAQSSLGGARSLRFSVVKRGISIPSSLELISNADESSA